MERVKSELTYRVYMVCVVVACTAAARQTRHVPMGRLSRVESLRTGSGRRAAVQRPQRGDHPNRVDTLGHKNPGSAIYPASASSIWCSVPRIALSWSAPESRSPR